MFDYTEMRKQLEQEKRFSVIYPLGWTMFGIGLLVLVAIVVL